MFLLMFPHSFIFSIVTFPSLIHLHLTLTYDEREASTWILLHIYVYSLKIIFHVCSCHRCHKNDGSVYINLFLGSIMFPWFMCPLLYQYLVVDTMLVCLLWNQVLYPLQGTFFSYCLKSVICYIFRTIFIWTEPNL